MTYTWILFMSFEYHVYFRPLTVHKILFMAMILLKHDVWLWHNMVCVLSMTDILSSSRRFNRTHLGCNN